MYFGKEVRLFLKDQAKDKQVYLQNSSEKRFQSIFRSVERITEILKENPQFGDPIAKNLIPAILDVQNLYRVELSNFWRMLYTLEGDNNNVFVFIIRIMDHEEYDDLFGYKNKK